jgi:peptide/nickel transport system permease protein
MLFGSQPVYETIPIDNYLIEDSIVKIRQYTGYEDFIGMEREFHIADVLFPIDSIKTRNDSLFVFFRNNPVETISIKDARNKLKNEHIYTQKYWLGTDRYGRDLLSQIIIGARVSLSVGFIAISIALLLGILLGSLAGFFRGATDNFIVWLINVVWSIPTLLLVIAITFALGKGFWQVFIAVGLTMWVDVARVVRGQIISIRENEYIEAARALGLPDFNIITKHILPNITGPVVVISAANFASAILIEAGLSFLGIGVQPPMPSWGTMIRENYGYIILDKAYLAIVPGICIMLLVMAFMLIGNGLRDAIDKSPANY